MLRALQPHGLAEVPAPQVPHYTGSSGKSSDDPDAIESLVQGYAAGAEAAGGRGGRGDEARDERRTRSPDEAARRGKEVEMEEPTRAGGAVQGIAATTKATTDGGAGNKGHESGSGGSAQYPDEAQCSPGAAGKKTRRLDQRQKSTWRAGKTEVGGGRKRVQAENRSTETVVQGNERAGRLRAHDSRAKIQTATVEHNTAMAEITEYWRTMGKTGDQKPVAEAILAAAATTSVAGEDAIKEHLRKDEKVMNQQASEHQAAAFSASFHALLMQEKKKWTEEVVAKLEADSEGEEEEEAGMTEVKEGEDGFGACKRERRKVRRRAVVEGRMINDAVERTPAARRGREPEVEEAAKNQKQQD